MAVSKGNGQDENAVPETKLERTVELLVRKSKLLRQYDMEQDKRLEQIEHAIMDLKRLMKDTIHLQALTEELAEAVLSGQRNERH